MTIVSVATAACTAHMQNRDRPGRAQSRMTSRAPGYEFFRRLRSRACFTHMPGRQNAPLTCHGTEWLPSERPAGKPASQGRTPRTSNDYEPV
jgi:hypothetical protein